MITVSRIPWEEQLRHSPNVLSDLKACGMTINRHRHVQINTMAGFLALFGRRPPDQIAILDAIPLLPTIIRFWCWPNVLLSTHGDRYIHMLFERFPLTGWILSLAECIETIDARSSTIVKSSGLAALESLKRRAPGPSYVHCPDRFLPYERRKVFIYQGVLRWDKGVDSAIRYANENNSTLIVVGDGPDRKRLMRVARSLGADVHFVGRVANPEPFWRIADEALVCRRKTRGNENAHPGLIHRAQAQNVKVVILQEDGR